MNPLPLTLLVVAKAPEPGRAKTRLAATVGDRVASEIAAAALLDTLDATAATPVAARVVALTGELDAAAGAADIRRRLESFTVIGQRGDDFADRLANAQLEQSIDRPLAVGVAAVFAGKHLAVLVEHRIRAPYCRVHYGVFRTQPRRVRNDGHRVRLTAGTPAFIRARQHVGHRRRLPTPAGTSMTLCLRKLATTGDDTSRTV
jgi:hypothetical protein